MTTDFLAAIVERKKAEVSDARKKIPETRLIQAAAKQQKTRPFLDRLRFPGPDGINIIAEIKRASPSKGLIRPDLDPVRYAKAYQRAGAAAISVLTDGPGFQGSEEDLANARQVISLPVLRKDFIISSFQIYASRVLGADAVLLIVRILSSDQLKDYLALCRDLTLDALVEVHSQNEIEVAVNAGARLIGINNRNLNTFTTRLDTTTDLASLLSSRQIAVAESGIRDRKDIERLMQAGIWNFLIGESLVRATDPERRLAHLLGKDP